MINCRKSRELHLFYNLHVPVQQKAHIEVVIIFSEGVGQVFAHFEPTHVEEELHQGIHRDVGVE